MNLVGDLNASKLLTQFKNGQTESNFKDVLRTIAYIALAQIAQVGVALGIVALGLWIATCSPTALTLGVISLGAAFVSGIALAILTSV